MTTKLFYSCDEEAPACHAAFEVTDAQSFAVAHVMLKEAGWTHRDGKDYCPTHSTEQTDT